MANATPNLTKKTLILVKAESVYATDAWGGSPPAGSYTGAGSTAYLIWDEINPLTPDTAIVSQQSVRAAFSKNQDLVGRQLWNLRPKTMLMCSPGYHEVAGLKAGNSPTAGVPPFFSALLRACALSETISTSASVIYQPTSSVFTSASSYVWADGLRHKVLGLFGTVVFEGKAGEGIMLSFDMKGNYAEPTDVAIPSATYPSDNKVLVQNEALTITPAGSSAYTPIVRSFRFDVGNQIIERRDMNSSRGLYGLWITDRQPTLELVVEVDTKANFNPWGDMSNESTGVNKLHKVIFTHGSTPNSVRFTFRELQLTNVQYQDDQGIRTYNLSYNITSQADNDDFKIETSF